MLLGRIDLIFWRRLIIDAGFHFRENQGLSIAGDDVDLAYATAEISADNLVTFVTQELRGSVFTEDGRSVPGARVELARIVDEKSTQKIDSRVTGETGEFVFRLSPETAKYRVTLKADGTEPASKDVEVESAVVYRVALAYKKNPK